MYNKKYKVFYTALAKIDYNQQIATDGETSEVINALGLNYRIRSSSKILRKTAKKFMIKSDLVKDHSNVPVVVKHINKDTVLQEY